MLYLLLDLSLSLPPPKRMFNRDTFWLLYNFFFFFWLPNLSFYLFLLKSIKGDSDKIVGMTSCIKITFLLFSLLFKYGFIILTPLNLFTKYNKHIVFLFFSHSFTYSLYSSPLLCIFKMKTDKLESLLDIKNIYYIYAFCDINENSWYKISCLLAKNWECNCQKQREIKNVLNHVWCYFLIQLSFFTKRERKVEYCLKIDR